MTDELVAVFSDPDAAARALAALQAQQVDGARVASPAPYPVIHLTGQPGPWRALAPIALGGGLTGLCCAAALQVVTSEHLGLVVGGKPIVAWPAFGVIMFELTMLFGGASTFLSLVVLAALARRKVSLRARQAVSSERVVVVVPLGGQDAARRAAIHQVLRDGPAEVL
jgi:hypothetical protein